MVTTATSKIQRERSIVDDGAMGRSRWSHNEVVLRNEVVYESRRLCVMAE